MTLKADFKKSKTDPCLLYRIHELGTVIFIVYIDGNLPIIYKAVLMGTIEFIKK